MRRIEPVEQVRELGVGDRLGRYELIRQLGYGGMAEVHLARATGIEGFQKLVVLKRILAHLARDDAFIRMFLAEARLAAMLDHHNIAQVFDLGRDEDDFYFVMEYVHGVDVREILKAASKTGGLPFEHGVAIAMGTAAGLDYAHGCTSFDGRPLGIVHRDVSPTNVLVTYDGCVKIVDFGVAKVVTRTDVTRAGTRKGKVPYMSPEQCQTADIDRRSDVFSLGILLWECTTNRRLFRGDNEFSIMHQIVNEDAPRPSTARNGYPPELEKIVMKALSRDRRVRYQTGRELLLDLEQLSADKGWRTSPASLAEVLHDLFGQPRPALELEAVGDPGPDADQSEITRGTPPSTASLPSDPSTKKPTLASDSDILDDRETAPLEILSASDLSELSEPVPAVAASSTSQTAPVAQSSSSGVTPGSYGSSVIRPAVGAPTPSSGAKIAALVVAWVGTLAVAAGVAAYVVSGEEAAPETPLPAAAEPPAATSDPASAARPPAAAIPTPAPPPPAPVPTDPETDGSAEDAPPESGAPGQAPAEDVKAEPEPADEKADKPEKKTKKKKKKKKAGDKDPDLDAFLPY